MLEPSKIPEELLVCTGILKKLGLYHWPQPRIVDPASEREGKQAPSKASFHVFLSGLCQKVWVFLFQII